MSENDGEKVSENPDDMEKELAGFETLLSDLMAFKNNAEGWSRNERFAYTQNFAKAFDDLIGDGKSSSSSDEIEDYEDADDYEDNGEKEKGNGTEKSKEIDKDKDNDKKNREEMQNMEDCDQALEPFH